MTAAPSLDPEACQALVEDLGQRFLGWRLREDYDALLAIGEGSLHVDLRTGEAWCDGDPLPPLFIAGELRSELERVFEGKPAFDAAVLDAEFHTRKQWHPDRETPFLEIACRVQLDVAGRSYGGDARTQPPDAV